MSDVSDFDMAELQNAMEGELMIEIAFKNRKDFPGIQI